METESLKKIHTLSASSQEQTHTESRLFLLQMRTEFDSFAKELQIDIVRDPLSRTSSPTENILFFFFHKDNPQYFQHWVFHGNQDHICLHSVDMFTIAFELTDNFQASLRTNRS